MPNRYVREAAIDSKAVNSLSWQAEVFWRRLLNKADDFGRLFADTELLRGELFRRQLDKVREADISRLLAECEKAGLLFVYVHDAKPFLVMNQWEQGRAKSSKYPAPPEAICKRLQTHVYTPQQMSPSPSQSPSQALTPTPKRYSKGQSNQCNGHSPTGLTGRTGGNPDSGLTKLTLENSALGRVAAEIRGNKHGWAYDNCKVSPADFPHNKSLVTVLHEFIGRISEAGVHTAWAEAVTRTHKAVVDEIRVSSVGGYCIACFREALGKEAGNLTAKNA